MILTRSLAVVVAALGCAATAHASDFWDEVRSPGLREYRRLLREGHKALDERQHIEALERAETAVERIEARPAAYLLKGRALAALRHAGPAAQAFRAALQRDATSLDDPEVGEVAVRSAVAAGDYELAARVLGRILKHMKPSARRRELFALHGDVLMTLGPESLADAILAYRQALKRAPPRDSTTPLSLALALHRGGHSRDVADALVREAAQRQGVLDAVAGLPLPPAERAARRALILEFQGEHGRARQAWVSAGRDASPWQAHAGAQVKRLERAGTVPLRLHLGDGGP